MKTLTADESVPGWAFIEALKEYSDDELRETARLQAVLKSQQFLRVRAVSEELIKRGIDYPGAPV